MNRKGKRKVKKPDWHLLGVTNKMGFFLPSPNAEVIT